MFEDCWFWSVDGLRLHGWYYRHERPRTALLFLHGNAGNLSHRAPVVKFLHSQALAGIVPADKLDSAAKIKTFVGPLLQSHGDRDATVPYSLGRKLFDAANQPKTFVSLPGRDHNDPKTDDYYRAMEGFLAKYLDAKTQAP